jgi:hypothetical protein
MAKIKRFTALILAVFMTASALVMVMPSTMAAIDGTAFYDEDYSGTAADYWIDISGTGTDLGGGDDSEHTIPFSFVMYGESFSELTVSSNGCIQMGTQTYISYSNYNLPTTSSYHQYEIAVFYDDMDAGDGAIYYEIQGTKLIVQWVDIERFSNHGTYTFQAILDNDDNSIRLNYMDMNPDIYTSSGDWYDTPTVGLNKGDGVEYEEYYYDSSYFSAGQGNYPATGTTILYSAYTPPGGVDIAGPTEVDEGTSANFLGTIAGYGTATGGGYSMDDTLIESFIDASGGTLLRTTGDDSYSTTTLPFDFEFFGIQYLAGRTIYISTNGYMDFGDPNTDHTDFSNDNIPSTTDPDNYIAPFWEDLRMWDTDGSAIYVDVGVSAGHAYMVIEWYNIPRYYHNFDGAGLTFEVILWDDSRIDLRYEDVTVGSSSYDYGAGATVGLENHDGSDGVLYSYNTASLIAGMNIRFSWSDYSGTGYQWIMDGVVVDQGPVDIDPYYTSISHVFGDGPSSNVAELIATFDGSPIDGAIHNIVVNNIAPEITDYSSPDIADVGSDSWIHGYVDDVPDDIVTIDVEVSGVEGEDWVILPHASTTYEYTFDLYGVKPGTYTVTVTASDDDGASASESRDRRSSW